MGSPLPGKPGLGRSAWCRWFRRRRGRPTLGDSIASRMVETGGVIGCNWPSYRRPAQWFDQKAG